MALTQKSGANSKTIATMKKIFRNLMLIAVAAMGFTACNDNIEETVRPIDPAEVKMTITANVDETRTWIDEENKRVQWSEGDALKVIENGATYRPTTETAIENGLAKFTVSFPENTTATEFTYNAIYPASRLSEDDADKMDMTKIKVILPDAQNPTATSFDPTADILVAKQIVTNAQPTELSMQFKRLVAMGKMTLTSLPASSTISKVIFTVEGAEENPNIAGRNYVDATTGTVREYGYYGATNTITLNYNEPISTRDIYFTCNPFELGAGDKFTVKVVCSDATYTREVTLPEGKTLGFIEGDLSKFSVNMESATKEEDTVSPYISETPFVCAEDNSTNAYSLGETVISGNEATGFKLGTSKLAGYFKSAAVGVSGDKYLNLYAVAWKGKSATLYIRVDGNTTTSLTLAANNGATSNPPYNALVFADTDHYSVKLTGLTANSTIEFSTNASFSNASDSNSGRAIVCGVKLTDEALGNEGSSDTPAPEPTPGDVQKVTVAEFLAAAEDSTIYELTGTITSVVNTTFGNFDLTDDTGTVYIYGLCSPEGTEKYWAESGAKLGDDITIQTIRTSHNNAPQGKNAIFVELVSPGTRAFWSFDATATSFTAAGGDKEIGLAIYNTTAEVVATSDNKQFTAAYADGALTITAKENTASEAIEGTITVTCGSLKQTIAVSQAAASSGAQTAVEAKVEFTKDNRTTFTTSQQVFEANDIKVINDKGSSTNNVADYAAPARFYKGSKITVSAPGNISTIVFDCNNASYATALENSGLTGTVSVSSDKVTVTLDGSSNEYVISSLTGGQVRMDSVTVTYLQ